MHLPILLPIYNLGLIIIDEEHEAGFQEKKHPKINTKELALLRAQLYNIPVLLGSATPAISSLYTAENKNWNIFKLTDRFAGNFPKVEIAFLKEKDNRASYWITKKLEKKIREKLLKKEQIIIFLNRRGYSFFVQCKDCGIIFSCLNCSVSLTLHSNKIIICHYCGYQELEPENCRSCESKSSLIKKGVGTQQIVSILEKLFPDAKIARADLDTTVNRKKWKTIVQDFQQEKIDILVGTQTITKGYHFPRVTLIGIIWADINLSFPVYNSAEITLQQLIQVAGRAGRQSVDSDVIVQAMIDHNIFKYINEKSYYNFYEHEIVQRKDVLYPPVVRLAEIEIRHSQEAIVEAESRNISEYINNFIEQNKLSVILLGPACPPVEKIKNINIRKIYLKSSSITNIHVIWNYLANKAFKSKLFFTPNPLS